jgi:paraquat-inducible protein A
MPSLLNTVNNEQMIACSECDLLLEHIPVEPGFKAHCPRCGYLLHHPVRDSVDKILALSWTGLFLSLPAYFLPILRLDLLGDEHEVSLLSGVWHLYKGGYWLIALAILLSSVLVPLVKKLLLLFVVWHLKAPRHSKGRRVPSNLALAFRGYHYLVAWGMLEVFLLAVMVAVIKLRDLGDLQPGIGLYCFIAVLAVAILQALNLDSRQFWTLIEQRHDARQN